jgi:hypothetical protein
VIALCIYSNAPIHFIESYLLRIYRPHSRTADDSISSFHPKVFQESVRVGCEDSVKNGMEAVKGGSPHPPRDRGRALQVIENMVDLVGIEPTTSSMPWKRAPSCATGPRANTSILADWDEIVKQKVVANVQQESPNFPVNGTNCLNLRLA